MGQKRLRAFGWALAVIFLLVGAASFYSGTTLGGRDPVSSQCAASPDVPSTGGPYFENTTVAGWVTYAPLGVTCSYDVPGDRVGAQTVAHQNWVESLVCVVSASLVVFGVWIAASRRPIPVAALNIRSEA